MDQDEIMVNESESYKKEVRKLDKNIENASLKWFINAGAITHEDYENYQLIRKRRNDITHEMLKNLNNGFNEKDASLLVKMLEIYFKLDKWWINEIEIPTSPENIPNDYDLTGVIGGQAMVLSIIYDILFGDGVSEYKKILDKIDDMRMI